MERFHLTSATLFILKALENSYQFGFDIMEATGLPSGTVYPALKRFEHRKLVRGHWENERSARLGHRPARRYYELTETGRRYLDLASKRFPELIEAFLPGRIPKMAS